MILNDIARLEVDASDLSNEIVNHSAQTNTTGWAVSGGASLSRKTGLTDHGYSGTALSVSSITGTSESLTGPTFSVSPGEWVNYQCEAFDDAVAISGLVINFNIQFLNSGGSVIQTKLVTDHLYIHVDQLFTAVGTAHQAPSGTVTARVQVSMASATGSSILDLAKFMAVKGPTQASVTGVAFSDAIVWQNVLGSATYFNIHRGLELDGVVDVLDVGTLTAEVLDPTLDPFENSRIEKGQIIRVRVFEDETLAADRTVFTGRIDTVSVDYSGSKRTSDPWSLSTDAPLDVSTRVTITATDGVQDLRNLSKATGKSGIFEQRIESATSAVTSILVNIVDTDSDTSEAVLTVDPNKSVYDQVILVRNTLQGYLWVDAVNTLQCRAANSAPSTTPVRLFSDDLADAASDTVFYTDITVRGGSDTVVNELMVTKEGVGVPNGSRQFGPYVNAASVATFGSLRAEVTINSGSPSSLAEDYLELYAEPRKFVQSVTFESSDDPYSHAADLEPYDVIEVKRTDILDDEYRILSIDHSVTPDAWFTTLGLRPVEDPATITVTKPAAGDDTGPADTVTSVIDPHNKRYRTSNLSIGDASSTTVDFNVAGANAGITWDSGDKALVVPLPGRYLATAVIGWPATAGGGRRSTAIALNGSAVASATAHSALNQIINVPISVVLYCAAGDEISVQAFQNSGGSLSINGAEATCALTVTYLGA